MWVLSFCGSELGTTITSWKQEFETYIGKTRKTSNLGNANAKKPERPATKPYQNIDFCKTVAPVAFFVLL